MSFRPIHDPETSSSRTREIFSRFRDALIIRGPLLLVVGLAIGGAMYWRAPKEATTEPVTPPVMQSPLAAAQVVPTPAAEPEGPAGGSQPEESASTAAPIVQSKSALQVFAEKEGLQAILATDDTVYLPPTSWRLLSTCPSLSGNNITISTSCILDGGSTYNYTGTLTISGASTILTLNTALGNLSLGTADVTLTGGAIMHQDGLNTVTIGGTLTVASGSWYRSGLNTTTLSNQVKISASNINVQSGGRIDTSCRGYQEAAGPAPSASNAQAASHGGLGGGKAVDDRYGSNTAPVTMGSGGLTVAGSIGNATQPPGCPGSQSGYYGGGVVRLSVSGTTTVDGAVRADALSLWGTNSFSLGAGGSVWITTGTLAGGGTISAHGGDNSPSNTGAGGGGGRIAVYRTSSSFSGSLDVHGGFSAGAGRTGSAGTTYETTTPGSTGVTSTPSTGSFNVADVIDVKITFSSAVTVTGVPYLTLSTGSPATTNVNYFSGSGTSTLTFRYTVAAGNTSSDLDYASANALVLNGGTIQDSLGNDVSLVLANPGAGGSLSANSTLVIDTTTPTITSVAPASSTSINSTTTSSDVSYTLSETVASGSITATRTGGAADSNSPHVCTLQGTALNIGAHSAFSLSSGANNCTAAQTALVDGAIYTFAFAATDGAGNAASTVSSTNVTFDGTAPVFSSVLPAASTSINSITASSDVSYTLSEAIASGTITMTRTGGSADASSPRTCTLTGTALASGAHNNLDLSNTTNSCTVGQSLVNGAVYTFVFAGTDAAGNAATSITRTSVTFDTSAPALAEVTPVSTPTTDTTPNYTFSSTEAGTITYGGSCSSATTSVSSGNNTITFNALTDGTYSDCTIQVTDTAGNQSSILGVTSFTVASDVTPPTVTQVTPVPSPTSDTTPNYTFNTTEAGTIQYGGDCSSATSSTTTGNRTVTFNALSAGTHSNCTIQVTDAAGNQSSALNVNTFVIDLTAPTLSEVTPVPDPTSDATPDYTFSTDEAGTITYGGSCSSATTSATVGNNTVTFNTLSNGTYTNCTIRVTDAAGNLSSLLDVSDFTVNTIVTTCPASGNNVTISSPCQYIAGTFTYTGTLTISAAVTAISNHPSISQVIIESDSINVTSSGSISATGKGYDTQLGPGAGAATYEGGTHGGRGGDNDSAVYGSMTAPTTSGSGGYNGGQGGGAIKLVASSTLTINGTVSATGNSVGGCARTGGAGGSIWIDAGTLAGSGTVDVRGSGGVTCGGGSPSSGGGGRIAAYYDAGSPTLTYRTAGGDSNFGFSGGSGTLFVMGPGASNGSLTLENGDITDGQRTPLPTTDTWTFDTLALLDGAELVLESGDNVTVTDSSVFNNADADAELYIEAGATLVTGSASMAVTGVNITNLGEISGSLANLTLNDDATLHEGGTSFPSLSSLTVNSGGVYSAANDDQHTITTVTVNSGGLLTHDNNSTTQAYGLDLSTTTFTLNSGGSVNVNARGYDGSEGPGAGTDTAGVGQGAGGGGHGGVGGNGSVGAGGSTYDSASAPVLLGSGGGNYTFGGFGGGEGGGRVKIAASASLTVNGSIVANGSDGHNNYSGGGSGGSIWLDVSGGTLSGTGAITANGGGTANAQGGCGGGGLVKLSYTTDSHSGSVTAAAGTSGCTNDGAAGVVQLISPTTTSISPNTKTAGDAGFTITVDGTNFTAGSVVRISGNSRVTTFVNATQLTAAILSGDIASAGLFSITVYDSNGGTSNAQTLTVNNPVPTTTSISPSTKYRNDAQFTLVVNGTNFVNGSVVKFNGSNRTTNFINSTQLTATILAGDLTATGTFPITVFNATPGGGTSNSQTLTVTNPVPGTSSLSPSTKNAGESTFTLTVNGANFVSNSVVQFEGSNRTTTYVSATQLTATINAADIATAGLYDITVFTPTPGGGTSNTQTLTVNGAVVVTHSPASPLTINEITIESDVNYGPGVDSIDIYLDGTDPGDLVHTCTLVGSPVTSSCDFNVGALAYGSHTATVIAHGADLNDQTGAHTFHVSDYTTINAVELTTHRTNANATATARYSLATTLSGPVVITFPEGFTVLSAPTAQGSSPCFSNFSFDAEDRTVTAVKAGCVGNVYVGGMTVINPSTGGIYFVSWVNDDPGGGPVYITAEEDINVTGNVDPYISFRVVATTDACDNGVDGFHDDTTPTGSGGTVALGTISPTSTASSGVGGVNHLCTFVSTNAGGGYSLGVRSTNGQLASASGSFPATPQTGTSTTATTQGGVEVYGMCQVSGSVGKDVSLPVGYDLSPTAPFNDTCSATLGSQNVGTLTTDTNIIGSGPGPVQDGWATWLIKASISAVTPPSALMTDTLTFVATSTY